jgi:hypothetical protein
MIDDCDSFTYNIVQYFGELGQEVKVCRNDAITCAFHTPTTFAIISMVDPFDLRLRTGTRGAPNLCRSGVLFVYGNVVNTGSARSPWGRTGVILIDGESRNVSENLTEVADQDWPRDSRD